jgi:protease I
MNPDALRSNEDAQVYATFLPPRQTRGGNLSWSLGSLIDARVVSGRTLTSWPAIKPDVKNAGGKGVNEEVVVDNGLVTSRKPDDIPAFNKKMIEEFCEGRYELMAAAGSGLLET